MMSSRHSCDGCVGGPPAPGGEPSGPEAVTRIKDNPLLAGQRCRETAAGGPPTGRSPLPSEGLAVTPRPSSRSRACLSEREVRIRGVATSWSWPPVRWHPRRQPRRPDLSRNAHRQWAVPGVLAITAFPASAATRVASDDFGGTLSSSVAGAPDLVAIDPLNLNRFESVLVGGETRTVYGWDRHGELPQNHAGLRLDATGLVSYDSCSVAITFEFTEPPRIGGGWRRSWTNKIASPTVTSTRAPTVRARACKRSRSHRPPSS